jgi:hypothetical protein
MATTITGKIKRKYLAHYVDSSVTPATPVYNRLGADLEEYKEELNPNVEKKKNILGENSVIIDSYEPQSSVEPYYAVVGDPLFVRLLAIAEERQTLDDLKTTVVDVHLWEEDATTAGSYVAYKEDAVFEVSSVGGDSTGLQIPFNLHKTGNRVKGLFALATKTFTAA